VQKKKKKKEEGLTRRGGGRFPTRGKGFARSSKEKENEMGKKKKKDTWRLPWENDMPAHKGGRPFDHEGGGKKGKVQSPKARFNAQKVGFPKKKSARARRGKFALQQSGLACKNHLRRKEKRAVL